MSGLFKRLAAALIALVLLASPSFADRIGILASEGDGNPSNAYAYAITFPNGTISITNGVLTYTPIAGAGDVTGVGDCASGACGDGTSDGGTYYRLYDGTANYLQLAVSGALGGNLTLNLDTLLTTASPQFAGINVGHASDTTITRTGAGAIAVEGTAVLLSGGDAGTPSAIVLTNGTGLPVATGISGLGANVATFLATPTLANLNSAVSDATLLDDGAIADSTAIGLTTGDNYTNFGAVTDDSLNEMFAAIDTAMGGLGGATVYNSIGDPTDNGSISFGAYTGAYTSATDGWGGITIDNTTADNASPTTLLTLKFADANDPTNNSFLKIIEDSDGTPVTVFEFKGRGLYLGANATIQNIATMTASSYFAPQSADGATLGTSSLEFSDLYLADGGVIYGQNDQSNTITSGSNGWTFSAIVIPTTTSGDQTRTVGQLGLKTDEDLLVTHGGANGEVQDEVGISLLQHIAFPFDPTAWYDQETTYRSVPIMVVGDDYPHGFTLTEWKVTYVGGDPTTELDADLICDTTPDYNTAAGATVMDVLDTTAGASSADTGFDSATCANGSFMYLHFGGDPVDSNVVVALDIWGYAEED